MKIAEIMNRDVVYIGEDESLALAEQMMLWNRVAHLPVLRPADGALTGMLSEREILLAHRSHPDEAKVLARSVREFMVPLVAEVEPGADVSSALVELGKRGLECLPVVERGTLVGVVTRTDLLRALAAQPEATTTATPADAAEVASIMHPEPLAVHENDSLVTVAMRMARARVRHACVVDGEGRLIGILSDRDLRRAFGDPRRAPVLERESALSATWRVGDVMTAKPYTVHEEDSVETVTRALATNRLGALPVVDAHERLHGIVSYIDVLEHFARAYRPQTQP